MTRVRGRGGAQVAVPLVSHAALQRMRGLGPDSAVDNVLLEWTLIIELLRAGSRKYCLPVLIGRVATDAHAAEGCRGCYFASLFDGDLLGGALPDQPVAAVAASAAVVLRSLGLEPSPDLAGRTVRGTVKAVTDCLGVLAWETPGNAPDGGGGGVIAGVRSVHEQARLRQALFGLCSERVLDRVEMAIGREGGPEVASRPATLASIASVQARAPPASPPLPGSPPAAAVPAAAKLLVTPAAAEEAQAQRMLEEAARLRAEAEKLKAESEKARDQARLELMQVVDPSLRAPDPFLPCRDR